jgi:NAD-dependent deacetylase
MTDPLAASIAALRDMIQDSRIVAGFTGAGISTESGVPDFRSPDSPWMRHKPIPFETFLHSAEARREAWRRKFVMDDLYRHARPSRGHLAIAALIASGRMPAVITQNIDGLHQASGLAEDRVIELHGNGTYAACLSCGRRHELEWVRSCFETSGEPPECEACGGILKAATISFGQAMPEAPMCRAESRSRMRSLSRRRIVPRRLSGGGVSAVRQRERSAAGDRQSRGDPARRGRRSGDPRGDRFRALANCAVISRAFALLKNSSHPGARFWLPLIHDDVILRLRSGC